MKITHQQINIQTTKIYDIHDLTDQVVDYIKANNLKNGIINIFAKHTTTAIVINENEPGLIQDFSHRLDEFNPIDAEYLHNLSHACEKDCINGHSHCNALFLPCSITLQIINNQLILGRWQRILFIELDKARSRSLNMMFTGE